MCIARYWFWFWYGEEIGTCVRYRIRGWSWELEEGAMTGYMARCM